MYDFGENSSDGKKFDRDFEFGLIGLALENLFGMPRSPLPEPKPSDFDDFSFPETKEIADFRGTVIDLDGKPITGAKITEYLDDDCEAATSGPNGEFVLHLKRQTVLVSVSVKAPGFAPRRFKLYVQGDDEPQLLDDSMRVDSTGRIIQPLRLGRGVEVTGRVVKNGKPQEGVVIGLKPCDTDFDLGPGAGSEATTDAAGYFRLSHILADAEFWAYAKIGSVPGDGAVSAYTHSDV